MTSFGGDLIAAGEFQGTDGLAARRVARWDGTAWHSYLPVRSSVRAVTVYKNELVIAGDFTLAGTTAVSHVARLVGTNWVPVGTGVNGSVNALLVYGQDLMAAGEFTIAGGVPAGRIARWNGNTWQPLAEGATGDYPAVRALALYRNSLVAIGEFTQAGSEQVGNVASWNGTRWQALGLGLSSYGGLMHNGQAHAFAEFHNELYATGDFSYAGGVAASGIACLRPTGWQALGAGLHGAGLCVAADAEALYVGGSFDTAGGVLANHVARWDGTEWMALDGGVTNTLGAAAVRALVTYDDQLVVAGRFDAAGGAPALSVAGWDGWTWQPFGNGLYGEVRALAVFNGDLIAGGSAALAGPDPQQLGAARWDGFHEWHPIGSDGLHGDVMALTVHDGALIAGGLLSTGNGPLAVARWDGCTWQRIGTNLWGTASTLLSIDDKLFAAGQLSVGSTSCSLARWDGTAWEPIPSLDGNVSGLAAIDGQLLVGGSFDSVGGFPAAGWAHQGCPPAAPTLCAGDMNCDGAVNMSDIDPFVAALRGPDAWSIDATYSGCPWLNGDCNADSNVTFADIDAFVARLGSACDSLRAHRQGAILPNVRP